MGAVCGQRTGGAGALCVHLEDPAGRAERRAGLCAGDKHPSLRLDGNELFSHTYHYIGMEPVRGLYEFESDDADSGEFTYFFLAPDTSAETYHIEFRYGSDADALSQYDAGDYAYWLASGISTDCDQTMIDNCIELFCTENLAG